MQESVSKGKAEKAGHVIRLDCIGVLAVTRL